MIIIPTKPDIKKPIGLSGQEKQDKFKQIEELAFKLQEDILTGKEIQVPQGLKIKDYLKYAKDILKLSMEGEQDTDDDLPNTAGELLAEMSAIVVSATAQGKFSSPQRTNQQINNESGSNKITR